MRIVLILLIGLSVSCGEGLNTPADGGNESFRADARPMTPLVVEVDGGSNPDANGEGSDANSNADASTTYPSLACHSICTKVLQTCSPALFIFTSVQGHFMGFEECQDSCVNGIWGQTVYECLGREACPRLDTCLSNIRTCERWCEKGREECFDVCGNNGPCINTCESQYGMCRDRCS